MAVTQRRPGVEGDGMDTYPTYRDGPVRPHRATATKPTDVALPRSRRTYAFKECLEDPVGSFELFCTDFRRQPGVRRARASTTRTATGRTSRE